MRTYLYCQVIWQRWHLVAGITKVEDGGCPGHSTHIAHDGVTRAKIRTIDKKGKEIELVEDFVLGNVQHPILCAGELLKKGWSICGGSGNVNLRHEKRDISAPIHRERNSLQFTGQDLHGGG